MEVLDGAEELFENHRKSFLLGNRVHLTLPGGKGRNCENLDSFRQNGTIYTILTVRKGRVLKEMLNEGKFFPGLEEVVQCIQTLLYTLELFHEHKLLHLDVSPDNIFMLDSRESGAFPTELLLLDFNSVYSVEDPSSYLEEYYPAKAGIYGSGGGAQKK